MKKIKKTHVFLGALYISLLALLSFCALNQSTKITKESEIERLGSKLAYVQLHFPAPPAGKSASAYTKDFAKDFNLPARGISNNIDQIVAYIEIVSVNVPDEVKAKIENYGLKGPQDCVINIVLGEYRNISIQEKKEHKAHKSNNQLPLSKPLQFGNYNKNSMSYKRVSTNSWVDEIIYSEDLVDGYDYISSKEYSCMGIIKSIKNNKEYVFEKKLRKPYSNEYKNITISIPPELISNLYKGIEVTPSHPNNNESFINTISNVVEAIPYVILLILRYIVANICMVLGCQTI